MLKKILIANRGEIAVRVIRACREMGIVPVAVYSDVDKNALHVRLADEAYYLGGAAPSESYLNIDKIISIAKQCGASALHPGYGFLAENSQFVRRCEEKGIIFIGPSSGAMEIMGTKTTSRAAMHKAGIPVVPGTLEPLEGEKAIIGEANRIGLPVLLKAASGGGGKGLRLVREEAELLPALQLARSESKSSFNDDSVYLEKYIEEPHHIEVQILADSHGQTVSLGERECSIQRRYQKVLEETPSPFLDEETRLKMGKIAVRAAEAVGYRNAGTVEFMVDRNKNFYFLEMNTRLQVEHPVTEMVTGIDLVKSQIRIAAGLPLHFAQEDVRAKGASLQCRIYAEDPENDFMPSPGEIIYLNSPAGGLGIRNDSGIYQGFVVPLEYDSLLSKLVTWGETRDEAIMRMLRALSEYQIYGIKTTIPFFKHILHHSRFRKGDYNTHFISSLKKTIKGWESQDKTAALLAAAAITYLDNRSGKKKSKRPVNRWKLQGRLEQSADRT